MELSRTTTFEAFCEIRHDRYCRALNLILKTKISSKLVSRCYLINLGGQKAGFLPRDKVLKLVNSRSHTLSPQHLVLITRHGLSGLQISRIDDDDLSDI